MRTARSSTVPGRVSITETPLDRDPPDRDPPGRTHPQTEIPLDTDPPPVNRITDRYKNITFPQLRSRAVARKQAPFCGKSEVLQHKLQSRVA